MKRNTQIILAVSLALGILFFATSYYVQIQQAEYVAQIKVLIAQQETKLISLAEVTDRNGADAVVAEIIKDCESEDRDRFDTLLGSLDTLQYAQLKEVDSLFSGCGSFYTQRKALMVARFTREFEVYADFLQLLSVVDSKAELVSYPLEKWRELVTLEQERVELSSSLVTIQKEILNALIDGVSVQSAQMKDKLVEAKEVNDNLSLLGVRIDALREEIIGL